MEGYILVATGPQKYFDMAIQAARSIRYFDRDRGICLACDNEASIPEAGRDLFTKICRLERIDELRGTEHHLYLNAISPFSRTIYVDADCLMANNRIHGIWDALRDYHVTFPGRKLSDGKWRVDIENLRRLLNVDYIVQLNGGVFYFDKSPETDEFFRTAQDLFENRREEVTVPHNTGGGWANEPIWGATMALTNSRIFPLDQHLNVSTLRAERWAMESEPCIKLWKEEREYRPVICHFLGLGGPKCPNDLYRAYSAMLMAREESERAAALAPQAN
jgi:hypothetical protein